MMRLRKNATAAVATAVLMLGAAACGGGNEPEADPPQTPTTSPTQSSPPTDPPGGPPEGWEDKFTRDQLGAARAALLRWEQWAQLSAEIYKKGKLTPEAKATLQEYDFFWQRNIVTLGETYDKGGLRRVESVKPLWSYVESVRLNKDGTGNAVIVQCTDYRPLRYTRNGEPQKINKPKHPVTPLLITMTKPDAEHGWMHQHAELKDKRSCAPAE